jgi:hypothetical protein
MYLSKRVKVVAGVSALLGVVMAGGAAFTAAGLVDNAGTPAFIGGTIVQNVNGTSVSDISFTYSDPAADAGDEGQALVTAVKLTFGDANAVTSVPVISFTGDDSTGGDDTAFEFLAADWSCTAIAEVSSAYVSTCTPTGALEAGQGGAYGIESITVTVPGLDPS